MKPVIRILGRSGSGKTTFITNIIGRFSQLKFSTIKHTRQKLDLVNNSKDTGKHLESGAVATFGIGKDSTEIVLRNHSLELEKAIQLLSIHSDIILIEGARESDFPTILLGETPPDAKIKNLLLRFPVRPELTEEDFVKIESIIFGLLKIT
jgi:molybdopterin-guanine dinucleotide biosynthesis protein MobB